MREMWHLAVQSAIVPCGSWVPRAMSGYMAGRRDCPPAIGKRLAVKASCAKAVGLASEESETFATSATWGREGNATRCLFVTGAPSQLASLGIALRAAS
jgi:hypothetical protein